MVEVAITISYMGRKGSFSKNILGMLKVVLGQADPFMHLAFNSGRLLYAAVTFLFMGIILSEGYKRTNMYHIISPRKIITEENLSELVERKFTVYTRATQINFKFSTLALMNLETVEFVSSKHRIEAY